VICLQVYSYLAQGLPLEATLTPVISPLVNLKRDQNADYDQDDLTERIADVSPELPFADKLLPYRVEDSEHPPALLF